MTGHRLNATAALRFPKRWGRYRPHRPYRPTPHIHKGLRADGTSAACAQPAHDAPNRTPEAPTFAHGLRGRRRSTPWPSGMPVGAVGQRGPPVAARGLGTTTPPVGARAAGAVANIDTVCLRAKKTHIGPGAIVGGGFGRFYVRRYPVATGANVSVLGRQRGGAGRWKEKERTHELGENKHQGPGCRRHYGRRHLARAAGRSAGRCHSGRGWPGAQGGGRRIGRGLGAGNGRLCFRGQDCGLQARSM